MRLPDPNQNDLNQRDKAVGQTVPELPPEVEAVFERAPSATQIKLLKLRELIFRTASSIDSIPALSETLKWGEPSYTPPKPQIGSSVRLAARENGSIALMFICHTHIVEEFRELYPDSLTFEGNRAIVIPSDTAIPESEVSHCIAMALTWHLIKV